MPRMVVRNQKIITIPWWVSEVAHDPRFEIFAIPGGVGSGKTTGTAIAFLYRILQNPRALRWWAVAPTHTKCKDTLLPSLIEVLGDFYGMFPDIHYKIVRSKPIEIVFKRTGQTLTLHSGDRPELFVGTNIAGWWITEAGMQKREVFERVQDRARSKQADRIVGYCEGTPEGIDNWYAEEFNLYPERADTLKGYRVITLHTDDNAQNLATNYIRRLIINYGHDSAKLQSYRFGRFAGFSRGNVLSEFFESRNVTLDIEEGSADPALPVALCFDFNFMPMTWSAWQLKTFTRNGVRFQKEVCVAESGLESTSLKGSCLEFASKFDPSRFRKTPVELWGDRSGHARSHKVEGTDFTNAQKYLREVYENVTIRAAREVTPVGASVDVVNKLLMYERAMIAGHCVNVRRSCQKTRWKKGTREIEKVPGETHTHHLEGFKYRLWELYKHTDFSNFLETEYKGFNP